MARDILSIAVATVSIERSFSMARDVIPYRRNRLWGKMIQEIMIAKAWDKFIRDDEDGDGGDGGDNVGVDFLDAEERGGCDTEEEAELRGLRLDNEAVNDMINVGPGDAEIGGDDDEAEFVLRNLRPGR